MSNDACYSIVLRDGQRVRVGSALYVADESGNRFIPIAEKHKPTDEEISGIITEWMDYEIYGSWCSEDIPHKYIVKLLSKVEVSELRVSVLRHLGYIPDPSFAYVYRIGLLDLYKLMSTHPILLCEAVVKAIGKWQEDWE